MKYQPLTLLALTGVVGIALSGCGSPKENAAPAPQTVEQRISEVQNNPNMPADAKARALEQIKASQAMNKGTQEANAKK